MNPSWPQVRIPRNGCEAAPPPPLVAAITQMRFCVLRFALPRPRDRQKEQKRLMGMLLQLHVGSHSRCSVTMEDGDTKWEMGRISRAPGAKLLSIIGSNSGPAKAWVTNMFTTFLDLLPQWCNPDSVYIITTLNSLRMIEAHDHSGMSKACDIIPIHVVTSGKSRQKFGTGLKIAVNAQFQSSLPSSACLPTSPWLPPSLWLPRPRNMRRGNPTFYLRAGEAGK